MQISEHRQVVVISGDNAGTLAPRATLFMQGLHAVEVADSGRAAHSAFALWTAIL
jgi:hypothetical protein